jgi:hypothetical protein
MALLMALLRALLWPLRRLRLGPKELSDDIPVVESSFFVERDITEWPREVIVKGDDLVLYIDKGDDDEPLPSLSVQIILQSSGYNRFLYDNQEDWLSGEIELPGIPTFEIKSKREAATIAVVTELVAVDVAAMEEDDPEPVCLSDPYRPPEKLRLVPANCPTPERFQGFLKAVADAIRDPELALSAFRRGGIVEQNLYVGHVFPVIYLALRTGREPGAVVECLSGFDISGARGGLEELARRAHRRMHGADTEPQATAGRLRRRLAALRRRWRDAVRTAWFHRLAVAVALLMAIAGWLDWSWAWVFVGVGVLSIDNWPDWRKAVAVPRHIDTEAAPPMSFQGGIALVIGWEIVGDAMLCALAVALGRGAAWWSM